MGTRHRGPAREVRALDAYIKLMRCTDSIAARLERRLAARGLTLRQLAVLEALLHLGPMSQRALGSKIMRSGGSVTAVVDTLVRKGLVRRERDDADRRANVLRLTARGRSVIRRVFPEHAADIADLFASLGPEEQRRLGDLCRSLGRAAAGGQE